MGDAGPYAGMLRRRWLKKNGPKIVYTAFYLVREALWRAALCCVIVPSALVGAMVISLWLCAVGFGTLSTQTLLQDYFYAAADDLTRGAPAGFVMERTCAEWKPLPIEVVPQVHKYRPLSECQTVTVTAVPVAKNAAQTAAQIKQSYWMLVGLSTFFVFFDVIAYLLSTLGWQVRWRVRRWIVHAKYVLGGRNGIPPL